MTFVNFDPKPEDIRTIAAMSARILSSSMRPEHHLLCQETRNNMIREAMRSAWALWYESMLMGLGGCTKVRDPDDQLLWETLFSDACND